MSVAVVFKCSGCDATADGTAQIRARWEWAYGEPPPGGGGLGAYRLTGDVLSVIPDGWVFPDPYTGACYCPVCWDVVLGEPEQDCS